MCTSVNIKSIFISILISLLCQNVNCQNDLNLLPNDSECGLEIDEDKIIGGVKTALGEYPWMALLEYRKPLGLGTHCGGALITKKYVLTAAHCVSARSLPKSWKLVSVRLGEWNTKTNPDCDNNGECAPPYLSIPIESKNIHKNYHLDNRTHDIALLRLKTEVEFTDYIRPICLPNINNDVRFLDLSEYDLHVAGWGKTEKGSSSDTLQKISIQEVDSSICNSKYLTVDIQISPKQFCAGGTKGRDTCQGDSGGPLNIKYINNGKINWYIIGLVNFGPSPCGLEDWPGVYTKVSSFLNWISSNVLP